MKTANNSGNSSNRKKERRRSGNQKESMKSSIKQSIRNKLQRIKRNGRKGQYAVTSNSSVASSVASDDLFNYNPPSPSMKALPPKAGARKLAKAPAKTPQFRVAEKKEFSSNTIQARKKPPSMQTSPSSKTSRKVAKIKERRELPLRHIKKATEPPGKRLKSRERRPRSRERRSKSRERRPKSRERRPKSLTADPEVAYRKYAMKVEAAKKKTKKKKKAPKQPESQEFRSFSDSSDYSVTDFERSYDSSASSVYSDPGFDTISYNDSDSESGFGSESHSDFSRSSDSSEYSSDETEGVTISTERSAWKRNPVTSRGRSPTKSCRKRDVPITGHISSPRISQQKSNSNHIRSPRRSAPSINTENRFFRDEKEEDSGDSSYASGTSYDSSESDASRSSSSSRSSYSDCQTNDDYYTTSYDEDTRHLRDSTFSGSWTDGPLSTYCSEETERTRPSREYPTLLKDISSHSMDESQSRLETRSSTAAVDSRDLGSIDENEHDEFVESRGTGNVVERERAEAKTTLEEQQGSALSWISRDLSSIDEDEYDEFVKSQEPRNVAGRERAEAKTTLGEQQGSVLSWIFGGSTDADNSLQKEKDDKETLVRVEKDKEELQCISSPKHSPLTIYSPRTPETPRSPFSVASSRMGFITRDRRSAIYSEDDMQDETDDILPTMSPGCSVDLDQIPVGGGSMPRPYGGLKGGEFLLPDYNDSESESKSESSDNEETSEEELSVSMRGSGTFLAAGEEEDKSIPLGKSAAPNEITFAPQSPDVTSPLSRSERAGSPTVADEEHGEDGSFFFCCLSPDNSIKVDCLPSSGAVEQEFNRMAAAKNQNSAFNFDEDGISALLDDNGDIDDDETTCASTIHTEGFRDLKVARPPSKLEEDEDEKSSSCAANIKLEIGPCTRGEYSASEDGCNTAAAEVEKGESTKRIKAESLDNYDISEILHGKRSFKSKTDDDGLPILIASSTAATGRRERRKMALKAHREFLYQTRSIDSNASFRKEEDDIADVKSTGDGQNQCSAEFKTSNDDTISAGLSVHSNSIIQDNVSTPSDGKPDALIDLVRNAFSAMMLPSNDAAISETSPVDAIIDTNVESPRIENAVDGNILPSPRAIEDALEVAYRFFVPKEEDAPLITEAQKDQENNLMCTNFNPNPAAKSKTTTEESGSSIAKQSSSIEASSSMDYENLSDTAVNSQSKTEAPGVSTVNDDSRFNADGIPLQLRPKKIWRAFDSGFSTSQSVVIPDVSTNNNISTEPESNRDQETKEKLHQRKMRLQEKEVKLYHSKNIPYKAEQQESSESQSKPKNEMGDLTNDGMGGIQLSTSPRYQRRAEMKRLKTLKLQHKDANASILDIKNGHVGEEEMQPVISKPKPTVDQTADETNIVNPAPSLSIKIEDKVIGAVTSSASPPSHRANSDYNISDIRARIKHRKRSKIQKQQLHQQQQVLKQTVAKKSKQKSQHSSSIVNPVQVMATTDRRDDCVSEFYDASDGQTEKKTEIPTRIGKYKVPMNDVRESILNSAISLD